MDGLVILYILIRFETVKDIIDTQSVLTKTDVLLG